MSKIQKLPKAPLQEVIFELLWEIGFDQQGSPVDSEFEFAQGLFANNVLPEFPVGKRTMPEGSPIKIYPKTIHQFWKAENKWPVLQIGPGIFAINDTEENYDWHNKFFPLIKNGIDKLEKSYRHSLVYKNVSLRYIDAVEMTIEERSDILKYVNDRFNLELSHGFSVPGSLSNLNLTQTFDVNEETKVSLIITDGVNKFNKPALIWQTHIISNARKDKSNIIEWVEMAHKITSNIFVDMLDKQFYDSFK